MTIKQQGGIFGRNPTFNNVDVEGTLIVDGEVITSPANNAKLDTANEFTQEQEIRVVDATAYDASAADAQVTVGPSLFLNNPANSNSTVAGQVVFGLRSTPYYARLGATGGSNPKIFVGLGTSEIARFTSSGLALSDGKGIDFSATAGTGTSELFDDYEEGNWTGTYGGNTATGTYTKIGRAVYVDILLSANSASFSTITGLPYTCGGSGYSGGFSIGRVARMDFLDANGVPCRVSVSGTTISFTTNVATGGDAGFTVTSNASGTVRAGLSGVYYV